MSKSDKFIGIMWFFVLQPLFFFVSIGVFVHALIQHFWS